MKQITPHYYGKFKCTGSSCDDNCCMGGWEIEVDGDTADYYGRVEGEFGDRLRCSLIKSENLFRFAQTSANGYFFALKDGKCPFLDENNLCEIYRRLGEEHMGVVCSQFPRFCEYYGNFRETGIGLACGEAARIIMLNTEPFVLTETDIDEEIYEDGEFDARLFDALRLVRDKFIEIVEDESIVFTVRLAILLQISERLQELINGGDYDALEGFAEMPREKLCAEMPREISAGRLDDAAYERAASGIWQAYLELDSLNAAWETARDCALKLLHGADADGCEDAGANGESDRCGAAGANGCEDAGTVARAYRRASDEFSEYVKPFEREFVNLTEYFIYRYMMKAAYDHDLLGKIKLAVTNYMIIRDMELARFVSNKGSLSFEERAEAVHIFSREVEYLEESADILSEAFIFDGAYKTKELIALAVTCGTVSD